MTVHSVLYKTGRLVLFAMSVPGVPVQRAVPTNFASSGAVDLTEFSLDKTSRSVLYEHGSAANR